MYNPAYTNCTTTINSAAFTPSVTFILLHKLTILAWEDQYNEEHKNKKGREEESQKLYNTINFYLGLLLYIGMKKKCNACMYICIQLYMFLGVF